MSRWRSTRSRSLTASQAIRKDRPYRDAISTLAVADFQKIKESTLQETWGESLDRYHRNMAWA